MRQADRRRAVWSRPGRPPRRGPAAARRPGSVTSMFTQASRAERTITITHSQTNRIAGLGILFPPRSIAPRMRCIIGGLSGIASGGGSSRLLPAVEGRRVAAEELGLGERRRFSNSWTSTRSFGAWMFAKPSVVPSRSISASRRGLLQVVHERDRAAGRDADGLAAPGACQRLARPPRTRARRCPPRTRSRSPPVWTTSETPYGRRLSKWRTSAACASSGSCSGWIRPLTLARANGHDRVDRARRPGARRLR